MGFNTTVVVLNDGLHYIEENPEQFVKNLLQAINEVWSSHEMAYVPCGNHSNVATVVETHHADNTAIIAVGGNCATIAGMAGGYRHCDDESLEKMLARTLKDLRTKIKVKKQKEKLAKV